MHKQVNSHRSKTLLNQRHNISASPRFESKPRHRQKSKRNKLLPKLRHLSDPEVVTKEEKSNFPYTQEQAVHYSQEMVAKIRKTEQWLASLQAEVRSKQRMVSQLNQKIGDMSKDQALELLEQQVFSRDRIIEQLNERVIALEATQDSGLEEVIKEKSQIIYQKQLENKKIIKERDAIEQQLFELREVLAQNRQKWEQEKEKVDECQLPYKQEIDQLKQQIQQKDSKFKEAAEDIKNLANVIQELKQLNKTQNDKIIELNDQLELKAQESYEYKLKSEHTEQLENQLAETMQENDKTMKKNSKISGLYTEMQTQIEIAQNQIGQGQQYLNEIITRMQKEPSLDAYVKELQQLSQQLKIRMHTPSYQIQEKQQASDVQQQLKLYQQAIQAAKVDQEIFKQRIEELKQSVQRYRDNIAQLQKGNTIQMDNLVQEIERYKQQKVQLQDLVDDKEIDTIKVQSKVDQQNYTIQEQKQIINKLELTIQGLQQQIKDGRTQYRRLAKEKRVVEVDQHQKDHKHRQIAMKLKVYEKEIFEKQTELIKFETQIARQNKLIEELKTQVAETSCKIRQVVQEENKQLNKKLSLFQNDSKILREVIHKALETMSDDQETTIKQLRDALRSKRVRRKEQV